jgi:hypothetical protein
VSLRAITNNNTAREKVLQNATLWAARSMRAVFCRTLQQETVLLAAPRSADTSEGWGAQIETKASVK